MFSSHASIERFGILFLSLAISMLVLLMSIGVRSYYIRRNQNTGRAIYTNSFTFSKSQTTGVVRGVYTSEDKSKCMLLLKFDSMSHISQKAEAYQMFLTGSTPNLTTSKLKSKPAGMFYLFGNSGYAGLYLYNEGGFPNQVLKLIVRSYDSLGKTIDTDQDDTTFNQYDQTTIYFNPGGTYAVPSKVLDGESIPTPEDIYNDMVIKPEELSIRNLLYSDLSLMTQAKLNANTLASRLKDSDVVLPDDPMEMTGDKLSVYAVDDDAKEQLVWNSKTSKWADKDTHKEYNMHDVIYAVDSQYIYPGGYDFDWQTSRVSKGFLKNITGKDSVSDWIDYLKTYRENAVQESKEQQFTDLEAMPWSYTDGTTIQLQTNSEDSAIDQNQSVVDNILEYMSCLQEYMTIKQKYQTEDLPKLLDLECSLHIGLTNYTVNTNKSGDMIVLY